MADADGNGTGEYQTFAGAGFGTLMIKLSTGVKETPPVASNRAYLRGGLPSIYQEGDFGMRFVGALESLLDPIVAVLDMLPAHFDPKYAPRDVLELLCAWLGVELDESQSVDERRETLRNAAELGRRRGTVSGLRLALNLTFPALPLRVEDEGGVVIGAAEGAVEAKPARFIVYCDTPVPEHTQARIARCIEQAKPVHTTYRLRVKAAKRKDQ